jgi:hypothetical protein
MRAWYHAVKGRLFMAQANETGGAVEWREALRRSAEGEAVSVTNWMIEALGFLYLRDLEALADGLGEQAVRHSRLGLQLAMRLAQHGSLRRADRLLRELAEGRPTAWNWRIWAEMAVQLRDRPNAQSRARRAYDLSNRSEEWRNWLQRVQAAVAPAPAPGPATGP